MTLKTIHITDLTEVSDLDLIGTLAIVLEFALDAAGVSLEQVTSSLVITDTPDDEDPVTTADLLIAEALRRARITWEGDIITSQHTVN